MAQSIVPSSVSGHVNLVRDIAPKYWKGVSDMTVRNHLTFHNLQKWGSLSFNARSHSQVWNAQIRLPTVSQAIENAPVEFVNTDTDIQYTIGIKGYRGGDFMPELEHLLAQNAPEMITDRYSRKSKLLAQSLVEKLSRSYYLDGNVAANVYDFVGLKTPLAYDSGTVVAADKIALPNGTYAGQSCALGNLGGTWSAAGAAFNASLAKDYPFGQGNAEYDGTSPLVVNYASTAWGTGGTSWALNAIAATSWAQTALLHRGGQSMVGAPAQCVMASDMFTDFKNSFRDNNRQIMPYTDGDLGYPGETLKVDGIVYSMDYNIPRGEAYMYLPQYVEGFFVHSQIYDAKGPEWSTAHTGHLYYVSSFGNFKFLPKYLVRFVSVT